jgi:hypothetical protein
MPDILFVLAALPGYLFGSVSSSRAKVLAGQALGRTVDELDRVFRQPPLDSRMSAWDTPNDQRLRYHNRLCTYCTSSINPGDTECRSCGAPAPKAPLIRMPQPPPDLR